MKTCQETYTIKEVTEHDDCYSIITTDSMGCMIKKKWGKEPKPGDKLTVINQGHSFGPIKGMELNGDVIFSFTDDELVADRQKMLAKMAQDKLDEFEKNKVQMDERYNALPKVFKDRIDRFRTNNDNFRVEFESYELFCCEQALVIAKACQTPAKIQEFRNMKWEEQMEMVPDLSDNHSGNTFGAACSLAHWYVSEPENVVKMHGALSPLVGSAAYGDIPKNQQ